MARPKRPKYVKGHRADLGEVLADQAQVVQSLWELDPSRKASDIFDSERWDADLGDRLTVRSKLTAADFGRGVADDLDSPFDSGALDDFIRSTSALSASNYNGYTLDRVKDALGLSDGVGDALANVFAIAVGSRLDQFARSTVATASSFGSADAARQAGAATKTWRTTSANPRPEHAAMNGETVDLSAPFSNGMAWPGDPAGDPDQTAGCQCEVDFGG